MGSQAGAIRAGRAFVELFADDSQLVRGLRSAEMRLKTFGSTLTRAGTGLLGIGAALAAPLAGAVGVFASFSDKMSAVRAVTNASQGDFAALNEEAKRLGRTTSFTASEVADGMKFLGMAGFDAKQIIAGIGPVLNMARAGAVDLGIASDIASDVSTAFGLTADEIGRVSDVMAMGANASNTSVELMGETFKYVAPIAKAAGQSLEEMAAAVGIVGNAGIKGSTAGTDLKTVLSRLAETDVQKKLAELGVATIEADGGMRPLMDTLRDLGAATKNFGEAKRLSLFMNLFLERAAKSAIVIADAGSSIDVLRSKMAGASGSAAKMALVMDDNVGGAFRMLLSAVEGVAIAIGEALAPTIINIADVLRNISEGTAVWVTQNQQLILTVTALVAGILALGATLVALGVTLNSLGTVLGAVRVSVQIILGLLGALLTPIGLLVAGLGAATAAWLTWSESGQQAAAAVSSSIGQALEFVREWIGAIADAIMAGDIAAAGQILAKTLEVVFRGVADAVANVWSWLTDRAVAGFHTIIAIAAQLGQFVVAVLRGIAKAFAFTGDTLAKLENHLAGVSALRDELARDALNKQHDESPELARARQELRDLMAARNQQITSPSRSQLLTQPPDLGAMEVPDEHKDVLTVPDGGVEVPDEFKDLLTKIDGGVAEAVENAELRDARTGAAAKRLSGVVGFDKVDKQVQELAAIHGRMDELVTLARRSRLVFTGDIA